jgi:hypothetical protein
MCHIVAYPDHKLFGCQPYFKSKTLALKYVIIMMYTKSIVFSCEQAIVCTLLTC